MTVRAPPAARVPRRAAAGLLAVSLLLIAACGGASSAGPRGDERDPVAVITATNFAETVEGSKGILVVDFWASWCGPCRTMKPIFHKLAGELADRAAFGAVDVDAQGELAERFKIRGIPTFVLFRDGKPVDSRVGVLGEPDLRKWILDHAGG